jgi:hypothetical protein
MMVECTQALSIIIEPNSINNGFRILSEYNFTFNTWDYCPGEYWPDNKTGNHTLIIFATEQPLEDALVSLKKLVKDNVYV